MKIDRLKHIACGIHTEHTQKSLEALAGKIRNLVSEDQLHEAIEELEVATAELSGGLHDDVILLRRRLKTTEDKERKGTALREELAASRQQIAEAILKTLRDISPTPPVIAPRRCLKPAEVKARRHYLECTRQHVENLLRESIHNECFIDLGATDTPIATNLPWVYKNTDSTQEFGSIDEAFQAYNRRLLILGVPGAGKTVTLLHLTLELIIEAESNLAAPIPLIVNLSKFRFEPSAPSIMERILQDRRQKPLSAHSFEAWLATEFAERPGVPRSDARRWIEEGRIAVLLDGLDEVNDERRADMAELLNNTYLRDHPDAIVVVCSRIDEYRPLQDRRATRLQLPGAITIQPLAPEQITMYLDAAHALGLRDALGRDSTLGELAYTPLTLSMMTLAYGKLATEDIPSFHLLADQRHHLMESFVSRMLQRKERRNRGIPFDDDRDKDVALNDFQYHPNKVNRYLSWLAICLSVRMQTACSLRKFHSFLAQGETAQPQTLEAWMTVFAKAVLLTLCLVLAVFAFVPFDWSFIFAVLAVVIAYCGTIHIVSALESWIERTNWNAGLVFLAVWTAPAALSFGAISYSIAVVVPLSLAPMSAGLIALTSCLGVVFIVGGGIAKDRESLLIPTATLLGLMFGAACIYAQWSPWSGDRTLAIAMVTGQMLGFFTLILSNVSGGREFLIGVGIAFGVLVIILALQAGALWLIGPLHWALACALVGTSLILILALAEQPTGPLVGLAFFSTISSLLFGKEGAVLGSALFGLFSLVWFIVMEMVDKEQDGLRNDLARFWENLLGAAQAYAEHWILSPTSAAIAAIFRLLPWRLCTFLRYTGQSFILKPFSGEIEFVHRRLRDYFALRELVPQLQGADPHQRINVIRALGFQGVAAIDLLAELIAKGRTEEKVVAVNAIARISVPEVTQHLEQTLTDAAPKVRRAVVSNLRNTTKEDLVRILTKAASDPEFSVRLAVIDAIQEHYEVLEGEEATPLLFTMLDKEQNVLELLRHISAKEDDRFVSAVGRSLPASCGPAVEALLSDVYAHTRVCACRWMGQNQQLANVSSILILLGTDPNSSVRRAAAGVLGQLGDGRAVEPLIRALTDKDSSVRRTAAGALGELGDGRAVEPLIRALTGKDSSVRRMTAGALGRLRYKGAKTSSGRRAAAGALGRLGDRRAVEPLIQTLAGKDSSVRRAATEALGRLGDKRAVEPLIQALVDKDSSMRRTAAEALGRLGDRRAVEPLIQALADKDSSVHEAAAKGLSELGGALTIEPLIRALANKDSSVRWMVVRALGQLGDGRVIEPLIQALADQDSSVREATAEELGRLGNRRAVEPLIQALADQDSSVRRAAAEGLSELRDRRVVEPLIQALADKNVWVREAAAEGLSGLRDARAVEPLIRTLADHDFSVRRRRAAIEILSRLRDVQGLIRVLANQDSLVRKAAVGVLSRLEDGRAVEPLIQALADKDSSVREVAAEGLSRLGDGRAVEPLIQALADKDSSMRRTAAKALGQLGDRRAVEPLIQALADKDSSVCEAAVEGLSRLEDGRAVEPLIQALADQDSSVRETAVKTLRKLGVALEPLLTDKSELKRRAAVEGMATNRSRIDQTLLSKDCDGLQPWIDPVDPITPNRVAKCAKKLRISEEEVQTYYQSIAAEFHLQLIW